MNLKNLSIYSGILILMVGFGVTLQYALIGLMSSPYASFSNESVNYMNSLIGNVDNSNFNNVTEKNVSDYQEDPLFLTDNTTGETTVTDNLASINFFKKTEQKVINPFKIVFNVPTFMLVLFKLDLAPFTALSILINLVIYIGLITAIIFSLK